MLKKITLVAMFLFGSAFSTADARQATSSGPKVAAPSAPVPHGLKCAGGC
jgi:hypothetical protein